jgi:hypothetical protein
MDPIIENDPLIQENVYNKIENHAWSPELYRKAEINFYKFPKLILNLNNSFLKSTLIYTYRKIFNQLRKVVNTKRKIFIKLNKKNNSNNFNEFKIRDLSSYSKTFQEKGYCFVENFLDETSYKNLLDNWPNENYFPLIGSPGKFYSFSFIFDMMDSNLLKQRNTDEKIKIVKNLNKFPVLENFYKFILSKNTSNNIKKVINNSNNEIWNCCLTLLTLAKEKSFLIPHIDGYIRMENVPKSINIGIFIDGNNENPKGSGALGLYKDNEFKEPIFIPKNLKNTALIYDTQKSIHHGFNFMEKNCYRKTINLAFKQC